MAVAKRVHRDTADEIEQHVAVGIGDRAALRLGHRDTRHYGIALQPGGNRSSSRRRNSVLRGPGIGVFRTAFWFLGCVGFMNAVSV